MTRRPLKIVVLGLSLSSSWGNGHATTYRALLKALLARGWARLDEPIRLPAWRQTALLIGHGFFGR